MATKKAAPKKNRAAMTGVKNKPRKRSTNGKRK